MKPTSLAFVWRLAKCGVLPLLLTTVLMAQQSVAPATADPGAADPCLRRSIPVTFIEKAKNASPLRPQDLQISVKGTTVSILSIAQDKHTPRVILLTDTSGSMGPPKGGPGWGIGLQIAEFAAAAISPEASVALGTFGEHLQVSEFQNRTSIVEQVLALRKIEPKGKTALYNTLSSTSSLFKRPQFGDAIYLVTDGRDNHSSVDLRQLEDELIARGVRVFVFLVVNINVPFHTPEEREGPDDMADMANTTGGRLISLQWSRKWSSKPEAASLAKSISDQVASPYRLELQLASPLRKSAKLSITPPHDPKAYTI